MHRNPMIKLRESAARFIRKLEEGTFIGIVSFGLNAKIELELTKKTRENEGDIIEKMPKEAKGPTAIGDGLQKALKVLGNITEGASFILVSDGEENKPCQGPCVKDIWPAVKRAGVVIDTVALGVSASEKLEAMSRDTGGTSYYIPNAHSSELDKAFFYTVKTIKSDLDLSEVLLSSVKSPVGYNITSFPILIDDSIGHNTMFTFITTRVSNLMADIVGPDLTRYNLTSRQCTVREEENMVLFKFSLAQSGLWTVNLKLNKQPETATVLMIVTSHLRSFQSETVTVESWTEYEVRKKHSNIVIKARVAKGNLPVTGATVDATVTTPNGSTVSIPMEETNQPGLFDGLFLGFNGIGRYSVETHVQNDGRAKIYKGGQSALQILEKFNRTASGGVFKNCYTRTGTMNPPDKVNDFTIIKHWLCGEEQCITFRWTSPSRNAAKTSECQINMSWSHDFIEIQKVVGRSNRVTDEQVKDGSLECVEESRKQTLSVAIDFTRYEEGEMVYFTVRVITDGNRIGDMSNMVKLTVSKEKRLSVSPVTTIKSTLESNVAESVDNETHYVKSTEFPELVSDNRFVHAIQKEVWVLPVICVHILTVIFIIVLSAVYIACKKHKNIRRLMPVNLLKAADNEKSETSNPDKKGISCEVESLQIIMDPRGKSITDSEGVCQINNMTSFYGRKGRPSLTLKAADKNNIFMVPPRIKPQPHESPTTCVEKEDKTTASSMVLLNSSTSKEPTREPEVSNEYEEVIIPLLDSDTVESIKKTLESERQTTRHSGIKLHMHLKTEDTK
ncbi:calcium-activated chloride channel regulator 1-like [Tachypleus tridentatus]|uniref:calcium-activated chloride channel regulator 1-like n=1 Tax=Tachypleus tridentatus TaxID=6853 RepID=UPI003FD272EA